MKADKLAYRICYAGKAGTTQWFGKLVENAAAFRSYMAERVLLRVLDSEEAAPVDAGQSNAALDNAEIVAGMLDNIETNMPWVIGEALAECVLADDKTRQIFWPWHMARDRRTPSASLPGADLVGFHINQDGVHFLFGEVQTSSDPDSPPRVMFGVGGLVQQLDKLANHKETKISLAEWLKWRCMSPSLKELYLNALAKLHGSTYVDLLVVGMLLRDTRPNELDIATAAKTLAQRIWHPTHLELSAWYLPTPIKSWPQLLHWRLS